MMRGDPLDHFTFSPAAAAAASENNHGLLDDDLVDEVKKGIIVFNHY